MIHLKRITSRSFEFSKNYYNVYGSPDIQATIVGSNEFEEDKRLHAYRSDEQGKFLGFDTDNTPSLDNEIYAAKTESSLRIK